MNEILYPAPLLDSQPNFRDLGGIEALDGSRIRKNLLYRSGSLHMLSENDIRKLAGLGLSMIVDFRADREIGKYPSRTIPTVRETRRIIIRDDARDTAALYVDRNDREGLERLLINDYRRLVRTHREEFHDFLQLLAMTENLPLVFHCAAGKDRTGLAAIFLLTALGVGMPVIRTDYFATNHYNREYTARVIAKINESGMNGELIRPLMEVRPEYLDAALDEIDRNYGGLHHYVQNHLGADVASLRTRYLEQ